MLALATDQPDILAGAGSRYELGNARMCGDWISLDDEVRRIMDGLAGGAPRRGDKALTPACRHGSGGGTASATIYYLEWKRPATGAAGKSGEHGKKTVGGNPTRQSLPLASARRANGI